MLVVDASAVVDLLLDRPAAPGMAASLEAHGYALHAPHLIDIEVASAVRRIVAAGDAPPRRGAQALDDLRDLPLERWPHEPLLDRVWALRDRLSAYDAAYVALAENLISGGASLLTADRRLARAARQVAELDVVLAAGP